MLVQNTKYKLNLAVHQNTINLSKTLIPADEEYIGDVASGAAIQYMPHKQGEWIARRVGEDIPVRPEIRQVFLVNSRGLLREKARQLRVLQRAREPRKEDDEMVFARVMKRKDRPPSTQVTPQKSKRVARCEDTPSTSSTLDMSRVDQALAQALEDSEMADVESEEEFGELEVRRKLSFGGLVEP